MQNRFDMASIHAEKYPSKRLVLRLLADFLGSEEQAFALMRRFSPLKLSIPNSREVERMAFCRKVYLRVKSSGFSPESVSATAAVFSISIPEVRKIVKVDSTFETRYQSFEQATTPPQNHCLPVDTRSFEIFPTE